MESYPDDWVDLLALLSSDMVRKSMMQKLMLAATTYFVWQERNKHLFSYTRKPPSILVKEIPDVVLKRIMWSSINKHDVHDAV